MSGLKAVQGQCCGNREEKRFLLAVEVSKGFIEEVVSELGPKDI